MVNDELIKYQGDLMKRVGNAISISSKLLSLVEPQLIPYRKGDKWGFSKPDKTIVIECIYDKATWFSEEVSVVIKDKKYGYINKQGKTVINFEYDNAEPFFHNVAVIEKVGKKGIINLRNEVLIEAKFNDIYFRRDDYISIKSGKQACLLNLNFQEVIAKKYQNIGLFTAEGLATFEINDDEYGYLYGYINKYGEEIIPAKFEYAEDFYKGVAIVSIDEEYFLINVRGNRISTNSFTYLASPRMEENENLFLCSKDDVFFGFIDNTGKEVIPFDYDELNLFTEGLAPAKKDGQWGFIDKNNKTIIDFKFDNAHQFSENLAGVVKDTKEGFINKKGEVIIPFSYDSNNWSHPFFENGYTNVELQNKVGLIDKVGNIIIPLEYEIAGYDNVEDIFFVSENGRDFQYISKDGLKYWED